MEQLKEQLNELKARLGKVEAALSVEEKRKQLRELEAKSAKPDFWQDQEAARRTMQELDALKGEIALVEEVEKEIADAISVSGAEELKEEVEQVVAKVQKKLDTLEISTFLSGKYDRGNAILGIHAGQGGTEAMDWAQMLLRMYLRYAESKNWDVEVVEQTSGEEAGIKSATLLIVGPYAYGLLKGEAGTHRLVRQSPFNADKLRQTSFALVEVLPELPETAEIEIKETDLDWQFFRASSQGGQNVQKVSTAVRLTHKPTGIVVTSQAERYQEQNRKIALSLLTARLWERMMAERQEKKEELKGEYRPAAWGTQIRSYVLHPYKMVKDLRTEVETSNTEAVLDGSLDQFVQAELRLL